MGYDPIFKQAPGPANIQPAPVSAASPDTKPAAATLTLPSNIYQTPIYPGTAFTPANDYQHTLPSYNPLDPALSPEPSHPMAHPGANANVQSDRKC